MRTPGQTVEDDESRLPSPWSYAVCYGLYVAILALCFYSFWVWRSTAEVVVSYVYRKSDALDAVYMMATVAIGLILFVLAVGSEPYLRGGVEQRRAYARRRGDGRPGRGPLRRLAERFSRLALPLIGGIFVALFLQEWALSGAIDANALPPAATGAPGSAAARGTPGGGGRVLPAPSTQERGGPAPSAWIAVAALAVGGTVLLAVWKRPS
jgi:hypothetical protein